MLSEVRLGFDDATGRHPVVGATDEDRAQQLAGNDLRLSRIERLR
jgi:hypothetical protein